MQNVVLSSAETLDPVFMHEESENGVRLLMTFGGGYSLT